MKLIRGWRKSSYSGGNGGECVEIAATTTGAAVRDTQNRHLGHLHAPTHEWNALLHTIKNIR